MSRDKHDKLSWWLKIYTDMNFLMIAKGQSYRHYTWVTKIKIWANPRSILLI